MTEKEEKERRKRGQIYLLFIEYKIFLHRHFR